MKTVPKQTPRQNRANAAPAAMTPAWLSFLLGSTLLMGTGIAGLTGCTTSSAPTSTQTPILVHSNNEQDAQLQRQVLQAISGEPGIDATRVGVTSSNGVVTLRGSVDTPLERQLAEDVAANVEGVVEIRNLLTFS